MTDRKNRRRRRLSHEILGLLAVSFGVSLFLFEFLSLTALSIAGAYFERQDILLTEGQSITLDTWIGSVSMAAAALFFVALFLILLGQRISYIRSITRGVEALQANQMDFTMPLEGNNELTQLAETINYLSATQREMKEKERALNAEKELLIRTLSHDIRTPLTSIMAYSEFLASREELAPDECRQYMRLIRKKAEQIKELTDILLDGGRRNPEHFDDARLLMEQLAAEAEEALEDVFAFTADLSGCAPFGGDFDAQELRRLFDNLVSNIRKYADPERAVSLSIAVEARGLVIYQENAKRKLSAPAESFRMGLNSIRRIAHNYGGRVDIAQDDAHFSITIVLSEF